MAIACYLAMTAAEFSVCTDLPSQIGWLSCHFSPSGPGLSNIPKALPPDSVLILDDSTPYHGHRADVILHQLQEAIIAMKIRAVILDFQRQKNQDVEALVSILQKELPCSVPTPPEYGGSGAVFLPPCPLHRPLKKHLAPYKGREIWLDISPLPAQITVTTKSSHYETIKDIPDAPHWEPTIHCHYNIGVENDCVVFSLIRNHESWLAEAEKLDITALVGLSQEFRK